MTDDERDRMIVETNTTTKLMHKELFGNGQPGRLPKLEGRIDEHAADLNRLSGGMSTAKWFLAGIGAVILALISVFTAHLLGGSK